MATLATSVAVKDPQGVVQSFGPGDPIPEWAAAQITNPKLWEGGVLPGGASAVESPAAPAQPAVGGADSAGLALVIELLQEVIAKVDDLTADVAGLTVEDDDSDADAGASGPPPKAGRGSGEEKWRAYAEEQGVDVTDLDGRDEIIARLADRDIAVE